MSLLPVPGFGAGADGSDAGVNDAVSDDKGTSTDLQSSPSATISAITVPTLMSFVSSCTWGMTMHSNIYSSLTS